MTSGSLALPAPAVRRDARRSNLLELTLAGASTFALFPLAWLLRRGLGLDAAEYAVGFTAFYGAYVINDPHFAVTYVLFYKNARARLFAKTLPRAQRVRALLAGVVAPVVLVTWAVASLALHGAQSIGWMTWLMFLLVGWHYVKQDFGVFTVLSARRGMQVTAGERKAILAHCYTAWAFAWSNPSTPAGVFEEKGIVYWSPAHPRLVELVTGGALALSTLVLVAVLADRWRRERRILPIGPLAVLLVTVWTWTVFSSLDPLLRYVIPALHSIQYLYFVWLMKRNEARAEVAANELGPSVTTRLTVLALSALALGWVFFHGAPSFLDGVLVPRPRHGADPGPMGLTPYLAALSVIVNVHHYAMDAVLWRRENPSMRYLREDAA